MKKFIIILIGLFTLPFQVYAVQNMNMDNRVGVDKEDSAVQRGKEVQLDQVEVSDEATGSEQNLDEDFMENEKKEIEEKNLQIQVENEGEDDQIQTKTEDQKQPGQSDDKGIGKQVREMAIQQAGKAIQNTFQQMNQNMGEEMGLGEQVRQLAKEQTQVQEDIDQSIEKTKKRGRFVKLLFGPDKKALDEIEEQISQNKVLIDELEQMAEEADQTAQSQIQAAQEMLESQNSYLQETIEAEKNTPGIFSFLSGLFN